MGRDPHRRKYLPQNPLGAAEGVAGDGDDIIDLGIPP